MCILIFTLIFILFSVPKINPVIQNKTKEKYEKLFGQKTIQITDYSFNKRYVMMSF